MVGARICNGSLLPIAPSSPVRTIRWSDVTFYYRFRYWIPRNMDMTRLARTASFQTGPCYLQTFFRNMVRLNNEPRALSVPHWIKESLIKISETRVFLTDSGRLQIDGFITVLDYSVVLHTTSSTTRCTWDTRPKLFLYSQVDVCKVWPWDIQKTSRVSQ